MGVGVEAGPVGEPVPLANAGQFYPLSPDWAGLLRVRADEVPVRDRGDLEVDVDPVEERARDPRPVALDIGLGAAADMHGVSEVAAGAGVHGCREHELCRKSEAYGGTGQRD